jgi:hypothetical protein
MHPTAHRITYLANIIPPLLMGIKEEDFSFKAAPRKWSRKQIIGHLIDSASNNHRRFILARVQDAPEISYDQDEWNDLSGYNEMNSTDVIYLWMYYNKLLSHIINGVLPADLERICRVGNNELTLDFIITDYVVHLEHHLRQVVEYE